MNGRKTLKIGISGSYGGFSLGDEAILQVIVSQLRRSLPVEITVFSRDGEDTVRRHHVERAVQSRQLSRRETQDLVAELNLFILGGGGILYDADADMYLREVLLAHEARTPVMIYAISAGPLVDLPLRARVRDALNQATVIAVRDRHTRQLLEELGVHRDIVLTADPAMLLEPEPLTLDEILRAEAIDPDARLVGFSVREPGPAAPDLHVEHYHRLLANAADFMIDRFDAEVVFFPTVLEQHVGVEARGDIEGAEPFPDSVGVGSYRLDLHPTTRQRTYVDISSWPFQIPMGALIPVRMENLLPAAKNIGVTHITNGCYRMHPVEWNVGEAAGALAAYCLSNSVTPRQVRNTPRRLEDFQRVLSSTLGVVLAWPNPRATVR